MLWFKFVLGLMFFELVSVIFAIVPVIMVMNTQQKKIKIAPKLNLNHNIYILLVFFRSRNLPFFLSTSQMTALNLTLTMVANRLILLMSYTVHVSFLYDF